VRRALLVLVATCLIGVLPARAAVPWINDDIDEAKRQSRLKKRPILIYFHTTWCSWCVELEDKVFSTAEVTDAVEAFIPLRVNADRRPANSLTSKYRITSFPSIVAVAPDGQVLGRLGMYRPVPEFLRFLNDCLTPGDTLAAIDERIAKGNAPPDLLLRSAQKHFEAGDFDTAKKRYEQTLATVTDAKNVELVTDARLGLATVKSSLGDEAGALEQYRLVLRNDQASRRLAEAFVGSLVILREGSRDAEIDALFKEFADRFPDDPAVLNDYARRLIETKGDLGLATRKAARAAALSPDSGDYHATYARALLQSGRSSEALAEVNRAIELRPVDTDIRVLRLEIWDAQRAIGAPTGTVPEEPPSATPKDP
jgi:thioredoxin-like negative regulator of GroEL